MRKPRRLEEKYDQTGNIGPEVIDAGLGTIKPILHIRCVRNVFTPISIFSTS